MASGHRVIRSETSGTTFVRIFSKDGCDQREVSNFALPYWPLPLKSKSGNEFPHSKGLRCTYSSQAELAPRADWLFADEVDLEQLLAVNRGPEFVGEPR